jgi:L-alanine-DL-glutamate epimerase-like enolase superfamily enzyme
VIIERIETYTHGNLSFVRLLTDDGLEGWGQIRHYWMSADIPALVFQRKMVPLVLGAAGQDIDALEQRILDANYRDLGPAIYRALSGLDTALWDLRGKQAGKSVCELLGGTPRSLSVYAAAIRRDISPDEEAERMARLCGEQDFRAVKTRIGRMCGHDEDEWPGRTEAIVPAVRYAVGDDVALMVDANSCYTPQKAIEVGRMLEDYGVFFYEEPCPYWELEWTAEVARALSVSVAGGEQDANLAVYRRMIGMGAVDVVQPDIGDCGGLTRALAIAQLAHEAGLPCIPHSSDRSLTLIHTMHMMCAIPNAGPYVEYLIEDTPWSDDLFAPAPVVEGGKLALPEGPGWGVRINPDWLKQARCDVFTGTARRRGG